MSDRWRYYSGYAQDDWRISNALTVNYGVRYEHTPPTWEGYYPDVLELQPDAAESRRRRPSWRLGIRRRGARSAGKKSMYEAWPWGSAHVSASSTP